MSPSGQLHSEDDMTRLRAAERAATGEGRELVATLLDMALHDTAEVKTAGGMAEQWDVVGDAAARALRGILGRQSDLDDRVRRAVSDLSEDDERVGVLLYYLGSRYEPVRRELEASGDERLRLRALLAVLSIERTAELNRRFFADPSPLVRAEALHGRAGLGREDFEAALRDPGAKVRLIAAQALTWHKDSDAYVAAARVETDPDVRLAFIGGLVVRAVTDEVRRALVGYLADADYIANLAADRLKTVDDPGVGAAIASRILIQRDEWSLAKLVGYRHLLKHAPELRGPLHHLYRCTPSGWLRRTLEKGLGDDPGRGDLGRLAGLFAERQIAAGLDPLPPGEPSPMLTRGPEDLRVRFSLGEPAVVSLGETVSVGFVRAQYAVLNVACPGCGVATRIEGPAEWKYRDDDRAAETEDGSAATLNGTCPMCGAGASAEVRFSITMSRADRSKELTWDTLSNGDH